METLAMFGEIDDIRLWLHDELNPHLRAQAKRGDPVELSPEEARALATASSPSLLGPTSPKTDGAAIDGLRRERSSLLRPSVP
jgi:hypothetical protein